MSNWKPGSRFYAAVERTKRLDAERKRRRDEEARQKEFAYAEPSESFNDKDEFDGDVCCGGCQDGTGCNHAEPVPVQSLYERTQSVEPEREEEIPFGSLQAFFDHLERFDWYCMMCDAYGCAAADDAHRDMDLMAKWNKLTGPAGDLYHAYYEHMFTGGSFSNRGPRQPKPARPEVD